jgi:hypothetical protein
MGRKVGPVILLFFGSCTLVFLSNYFALASYGNDGYFVVILNLAITILFFYFGINLGEFKNNRPLGLAIFLPGMLIIIIALVSMFDDFRTLKPNVLEFLKYYSKCMLVNGIIICAIGCTLFIFKDVFKPKSLLKAPDKISSDIDLYFQKQPSSVPNNDEQDIIKLYNELKQKYGRNWSEKGIFLKIQEDLSFDQELIKNTINSFKKQQET